MTILMGDSGRVSIGPAKTASATYNFVENNLTSVDLPTTTPATGQIKFTIDNTVLPVFDNPNASYWLVPYIVAGGKNNSGVGTGTINYEVYKNDVLWQSGNKTNVTVNQYWTFCFLKYDTVAVNAGDVIEVKLWASVTGISYYYNAYMVIPSRIDFGLKFGTSLYGLTVYGSKPELIFQGATGGGAKANSNTGAMYTYVASSTAFSIFSLGNTSGIAYPPFLQFVHSTYKLFTCQYGDFQAGTNATVVMHATNMPALVQQAFPTSISYREVFL